MIEAIILGGLCFIVGLYVGRHIELAKARGFIMVHMMNTSNVIRISHKVLEKYGLLDEALARLYEAGYSLEHVSTKNKGED